MFTIPALMAKPATATPATPATDVAEVAMSQVAPLTDKRFRDQGFRRAVNAARDSAQLEEWRAPLVLGHLVVCGNCDAFRFGANPAGLGHCGRYDTEAAPFCPFQCLGFQVAKEPAAPAFLPDPDGARARARAYRHSGEPNVSIALTNMVLELEKRVVALERTVSASPRSLANLLAQAAAKRAQGDALRAEITALMKAHPGQKAYTIRSYLTRNPLPSLRRVQQLLKELRAASSASR